MASFGLWRALCRSLCPAIRGCGGDGVTSAGFAAEDRALLRVGGPDARHFLPEHGDRQRCAPARSGPVYAPLLTPQGKYLFDFAGGRRGRGVFVDVAAGRAAALAQRLGLYRLRAAVTIEADPRTVLVGIEGATAPLPSLIPGTRARLARPMSPIRGRRRAGAAGARGADRVRVAHRVPETGIELVPEASYIRRWASERLGGADFRRGCYVGQEVTGPDEAQDRPEEGSGRRGPGRAAAAAGDRIRAGDRSAGTLFLESAGALAFCASTAPRGARGGWGSVARHCPDRA